VELCYHGPVMIICLHMGRSFSCVLRRSRTEQSRGESFAHISISHVMCCAVTAVLCALALGRKKKSTGDLLLLLEWAGTAEKLRISKSEQRGRAIQIISYHCRSQQSSTFYM
jgi:hypothetical protein